MFAKRWNLLPSQFKCLHTIEDIYPIEVGNPTIQQIRLIHKLPATRRDIREVLEGMINTAIPPIRAKQKAMANTLTRKEMILF